jgi:two-component sensor histidine kinase
LAEVLLSLDTAIPCASIVNELVSNSLKYAFPNGRSGVFHLALTYDPGEEIVLSVSDNDVGRPTNREPKHAEILGLQLVNTLTTHLRGALDVRSDGGVQFRLAFPEPKPKSSR